MTPSIKETVERLRVVAHNERLNNGDMRGTTPIMREAAALIERLAGALGKIADLDVEYPRATVYRDDGQYSKHDKCPHDHWMYEGCESCIADFARRALSGEPTP